MDDSTLFRIWFVIAIIGCILVAVLPMLGVPVD